MFYEAELRLLRDAFRKCNIQTIIADLSSPISEHPEIQFYVMPPEIMDTKKPLSEYMPTVNPATIYRTRDPYNLRYLYLALPELPADAILVIGPYLTEPPSDGQIMEWAENQGISPAEQKTIQAYYTGLPILPDSSHMLVLLEAFAERIWGTNEFTIEDIEQDSAYLPTLLPNKHISTDHADTLWNIQSIEQRYSYENEIMHAVAKGQIHKIDALLAHPAPSFFEQRVADPVRNAKNYCIIMNTLLRKAAEKGGVHPLYLDSNSSSYANKIEQLLSLESVIPLMAEMFQSYCRLVRKHSMNRYSPPVQKAITVIDADLTGDLTLRSIAHTLNVSGSYLSTLFKKETGQTLTEYINQRRIKHAKHLLETTRLQVQTIAQHCGIVDVQYFSRVFKRITGMTPKEYRQTKKW